MNIIYCYLLQQYTLYFKKLKYRYKKEGGYTKAMGAVMSPPSELSSKHRFNLKLISYYKKNKIYLKKTYLGPKQRVWRRLGPFSSSRTLLVMSKGPRWPSLAVIGCCGPMWACVGLPWAAVGLHWPSVGCCSTLPSPTVSERNRAVPSSSEQFRAFPSVSDHISTKFRAVLTNSECFRSTL